MTSARLSMGNLDDGALARAAAAGDRSAFAEIYDRYADRLHDFCIGMLRDRDAAADCVQDVFVTAATKLVQLREPDRLRSWLYAIARSEALARIRARKRELVSEELPEMPSGEADLATLAERSELADLIRDASGGLSDRDRTVLELAYRQGLDGPELADALGVTPKNANTLVERLRDTIARSLGALLVCRRTTADPDRCPELAAILDQWDGEFTVLMRKRVARHIDGCSVCEDERARMVSPAALLGATPLVIPAPAWLRERTLDRAVVHVPDTGAAPSGPEDDESWWPPRDFDAHDPAGSGGSGASGGSGQSGSAARVRRQRAGVGAALVVLAVGAAALLAAPAAFRVVPANSPERLAPPTTTTVVTTTPSVAGRPAPTDTPTTLPPALLTTTTAVVAPTAETTYEPPPPSTPAPASAPEPPTTSKPVTTTSRPVTTRPRPTTEEPPEPEPVTTSPAPEPKPEPEPEPEPPPSSPKKPPTLTVTKVPPKQVEPECPPSQPNCQDGPIFN